MATITYKVLFDIPNQKVVFRDTTDYTGYTGDIHGLVSIMAPDGSWTVVGSTSAPNIDIPAADFTPSGQASREQQYTIATGNWDGQWVVQYDIYPNGGAGAQEIAMTSQFIYNYTTPTPSLSLDVSTVASQVTSTDGTNYTSGGAWTEISKTRVHKIFAPIGSLDSSGNAIPSPADSGSSASIIYTGITTGTWTSSLDTSIELSIDSPVAQQSVTYPGIYGVLDTITATASASAQSAIGLCDVYCCLKALNVRYEEAKCMNKSLAEDYKNKIEDVTRLVTLYNQSLDCGLSGDAEVYLTEIKNISECNTECNCYGTDSVPSRIPILSSTSSVSYNLAAGSTNMRITSSGSGTSADPVAYNLDLGTEVSGNINYIANNLQATSDNAAQIIKLNDALTYEINNIPDGVNQQVLNVSVDTQNSSVRTTQLFAASNVFNSGTSTVSANLSEKNFDDRNTAFTTSNLYASKFLDGLFSVTSESNDSTGLKVDITSKTTNGLGAFSFRFLDKDTNEPVTNRRLSEYESEINITFRIITQ